MKKLLIFLMAFTLFAACNNDKGKMSRDDRNADYRDKDDYNNNDDKNTDDRNQDKNTSNEGWTERDKSKFFTECMSGFGNNQEMGKKICPCALEKFQKKYNSYAEVETKSNEAEGNRIGAQCKEDLNISTNNDNTGSNDDADADKSNYAGGWSRSDENKFIDECAGTATKNVGEERANQYCKCMLNKMKREYSNYAEAERALSRMTQDQINRLAEDCN
jgi:hypothetical protein